jgi:hypothetical protein
MVGRKSDLAERGEEEEDVYDVEDSEGDDSKSLTGWQVMDVLLLLATCIMGLAVLVLILHNVSFADRDENGNVSLDDVVGLKNGTISQFKSSLHAVVEHHVKQIGSVVQAVRPHVETTVGGQQMGTNDPTNVPNDTTKPLLSFSEFEERMNATSDEILYRLEQRHLEARRTEAQGNMSRVTQLLYNVSEADLAADNAYSSDEPQLEQGVSGNGDVTYAITKVNLRVLHGQV